MTKVFVSFSFLLISMDLNRTFRALVESEGILMRKLWESLPDTVVIFGVSFPNQWIIDIFNIPLLSSIVMFMGHIPPVVVFNGMSISLNIGISLSNTEILLFGVFF